jgi:hypothetical protein
VLYQNESPASLRENRARFAEEFARTGLLVFPHLLRGDALFDAFVADVRRLVGMLGERAGLSFDAGLPLDRMVTNLAARDRAALGVVYDLGTQPNKLISGHELKAHPAFIEFARAVFGPEALLATPALSDTLHVFPPGEENFRYNLPVHQDYPYLLQSPRQFTVWINLGTARDGVGGITVWPGSHRDEVRRTTTTRLGHLESLVTARDLERYESLDLTSDAGDVVIMSAHLLHRSNRNTTENESRVVQLFRYSDLADERAAAFAWASAERRTAPKATFADLYPALLVEPGVAEGPRSEQAG